MTHCHCSMCRKLHGASFATYVAAPAASFRWTRGDTPITSFESSPGTLRAFCARCGSVTPGPPDGERQFVPAGCLEGDPGVRPVAHIFAASRAPWTEIRDDLRVFDAFPRGWSDVDIAPEPRTPSSPGALRGSCLCGDVSFVVEGAPAVMANCHCSRCRRSRAAAHATNVLVTDGQLRFTRGGDDLPSYRVPDAESFSTCFCPRCGSMLPRIGRAGRIVVPAGCIDGDPGLRPEAHIFCDSKAPWYEIPEGLPCFPAYPPGFGTAPVPRPDGSTT